MCLKPGTFWRRLEVPGFNSPVNEQLLELELTQKIVHFEKQFPPSFHRAVEVNGILCRGPSQAH
jgi:hypothetical protein